MQTKLDIDGDVESGPPEVPVFTHDGDPFLSSHVHNARKRPNPWGDSVGKVNRSSRKLIDYAVTMIGARMGQRIALNSPKVRLSTGQTRKAVTL